MIVKQLNELQEKRGAKLQEADALFKKADAEKRSLSADELGKIESLQGEANAITREYEVRAKQAAIESQSALVLSKSEARDLNRFDYQKLLTHLHRSAKGLPTKVDGIEAEMLQHGENEARTSGIQAGGIFLPRLLVRGAKSLETRDMTATGGSSGDQGGNTIATAKAGLLDDFYNGSVLRQAGATVLEGLQGNLDIVRYVAPTAPAGKAENATSDELSPTTALGTISPKRLPAHVDISERLLMQSSLAIEAVLRRGINSQLLAVQEAAFFHGGGTNEAQGILGTVGLGSVEGGTNGAAPTWAHLVALETAVDTTNALTGSLNYISNGQIRGKLKSTPKVSGTDSRMILDDVAGGLINGYNAYFTNAVRRNLTKGSSSLCSAILFGNFADYWVGYWGGISLEMVRDKTNAISGLYTLVASTYYDGVVVRPKSFASMTDALGA